MRPLELKDAWNKVEATSENLVRSFGFAALQSPIDGATQLVNHISGRKWLPHLQIIDAPKQAEYASSEWFAQQIGGGAGIAADFLLLGAAGRGFIRTGGRLAESLGLASAISGTRIANLGCSLIPRSQVTKAVIAGAAYEGILLPVRPDEGDFWRARFNNSIVGAASFGTLAYTSKRIVTGLERWKETTVGGFLHRRPMLGIAAGAPAGIVNAELSSLLAGKGFSESEDLQATVVGFMTVGGVLGLAHERASRFSRAREQRRIDGKEETTGERAQRESPNNQILKFLLKKLKLSDTEDVPPLQQLFATAARNQVDMSQGRFNNADLQGLKAPDAMLQGADFSNSNLSRCYLWLSNLVRAKFSGTNLKEALLRSTNLESADFRNANLEGADFDAARAPGADFRGANLRATKFTGTDLRGADFTGADTTGADFTGANLKGAKGLK